MMMLMLSEGILLTLLTGASVLSLIRYCMLMK